MVSRTLGISELQSEAEVADVPVTRCWGAFLLAVLEAVCVFYISAAKVGLAVAASGIAASAWATLLHRDIFRIPLLALASLAALLNLFLLWHARNLRNAPAASWRRRPPTRSEYWRAATVVVLSLLTLTLALAEVWIHHVLHS